MDLKQQQKRAVCWLASLCSITFSFPSQLLRTILVALPPAQDTPLGQSNYGVRFHLWMQQGK